MADNQRFVVKYRRKRVGRTDYKKRLNLLAGDTPRLVVRKSLHHMRLQLVEYIPTGDKVIASATTEELRKQGFKGNSSSLPAAYLCGLLLAKKAREKKVDKAVADLGLATPVGGSVLFAAIAGARAGGLDVPAADDSLPAEDRLKGKHIAAYAVKLKDNQDVYKRTFARYIKEGLAPEDMEKHVKEVETKLK